MMTQEEEAGEVFKIVELYERRELTRSFPLLSQLASAEKARQDCCLEMLREGKGKGKGKGTTLTGYSS